MGRNFCLAGRCLDVEIGTQTMLGTTTFYSPTNLAYADGSVFGYNYLGVFRGIDVETGVQTHVIGNAYLYGSIYGSGGYAYGNGVFYAMCTDVQLKGQHVAAGQFSLHFLLR